MMHWSCWIFYGKVDFYWIWVFKQRIRNESFKWLHEFKQQKKLLLASVATNGKR